MGDMADDHLDRQFHPDDVEEYESLEDDINKILLAPTSYSEKKVKLIELGMSDRDIDTVLGKEEDWY